MKNKLLIFLLGLMFATMQACGPKTEMNEESEAMDAVETTPVASNDISVAERRANIEIARAELAEQRRIASEELAKTTPFYILDNGKLVYNKTETPPSFTGGENAMNQFLEDNLQYPQSAADEGVEGTVFVDFIVGENGVVREATVTSFTFDDIDPAFKTEALRVVNLMPRWVPGRQHGKPVDVKYSIPITFMLL